MRKGVSYIELLVVIGLISIIGASVSPFLSNFILRNNLETTVDNIVSTLRKSQSYAIDGKNNESGEDWGVCFYNNTTIRLFLGSCNSPTIKEDFSVSGSVEITGFNTITFSRLEGEPSQTLTITVSTDIATRTIVLNAAGGIGASQSGPPIDLPTPTPTPTPTPGPTPTPTPTFTPTPTPTPTGPLSTINFDSGYQESNVGAGGWSDACGTHSEDEACNATATYSFVTPSGVGTFEVVLNGELGLHHGSAEVHSDLRRLCVDTTCYDDFTWICKANGLCCFWHYSQTWNKGRVGPFPTSSGTSHTISYYVQGGCSDWGEKTRAKVYGTIDFYAL